MAAPDFSSKTVELLAYRSALICNRPECKKLTVGPSKAKNPLSLLYGEAAHICGARPGSARYDPSMTDTQRALFDNGVWLCSGCHTMADKNVGADFTVKEMRDWKTAHEAAIEALMKSQASPFPYLRQYAIESEVAQDIVNMLGNKGAIFEAMSMEFPDHVELSVKDLRDRLMEFVKLVKHDQPLQNHIKDLADACRHVMNIMSNNRSRWPTELMALRSKVGVFLHTLEDEYGAKARGKIRDIM